MITRTPLILVITLALSCGETLDFGPRSMEGPCVTSCGVSVTMVYPQSGYAQSDRELFRREGVTVVDLPADSLACERVNQAESNILNTLQYHTEIDAIAACKGLTGWRVELVESKDNGIYVHGPNMRAPGFTSTLGKRMVVTFVPSRQVWTQSQTLAHEYVHAIITTGAPGTEQVGQVDHMHWHEEGLFYSIEKATNPWVL